MLKKVFLLKVKGDWWVVRGLNCGQSNDYPGGYDWYPCQHERFIKVVYDRNHLFGLGPIPKPKLKIGRNFRPIPKLTKTVELESIISKNFSYHVNY